MKAMVVYDSLHGNTEKVAQAVAEAVARGLGPSGEVETRHVNEVELEQLAELDIMIVGAPTHAFRPSPPTREFLTRIPARGLIGVRVGAFDTRVPEEDVESRIFSFFVQFFGYAAKPIADRLQRKGGDVALAPEGFFVKGTEGPLLDGELERAADWASGIVETS